MIKSVFVRSTQKKSVIMVSSLRPFFPTLHIVTRMAVAAIFLISGISKGVDMDGTVQSILGYDIVGISAAHTLSWLVVAGEIGLGLWLASGIKAKWSLALSIVAFSFFTMLIASAWARGLAIDCGCFGNGDIPENPARAYIIDIIRDISFIALSAVSLVCGGFFHSEDSDELETVEPELVSA